jgi:hypothetical protein
VKTISVTQDRGSSAFQLHVREFVPVEGDRLLKDWMHNGVRKSADFLLTLLRISELRRGSYSISLTRTLRRI